MKVRREQTKDGDKKLPKNDSVGVLESLGNLGQISQTLFLWEDFTGKAVFRKISESRIRQTGDRTRQDVHLEAVRQARRNRLFCINSETEIMKTRNERKTTMFTEQTFLSSLAVPEKRVTLKSS